MARSGDLEVEVTPGNARRVTEAEVVASHHRQNRLRKHPLLGRLLSDKGAAVEKPVSEITLDEKDVRQYVMGNLAWRMGATALALAQGYSASRNGSLGLAPQAVWPLLKAVAARMHDEGLIQATPHDDDLFLLLK